MKKTLVETTYNMTSQLIRPQENAQNLEQLINNWKNNQLLVMFTFCLLIVMLCAVISWFVYSKRKINDKIRLAENFDFEANKNFKINNELLRSYYLR